MRYLKGKRTGIIGLGNMGRAILNGLVSSGAVRKSAIIGLDADSGKCRDIKKRFGITISKSIKELVGRSHIVLIAVKPQDIDPVLDEIARCCKNRLYISIAAGVKTPRLENKLGDHARVVRVMPNTPALVGEGISALCKGRYASRSDLKTADEIFSSVGEVVELNEKYFDLVTALSASGPAYFFYLIEALIKAGVDLGLKKEIALRLVSKTALGSARLLIESEVAPEILRARVTSKGGTTIEAIRIFEKAKTKETVARAVRAAARRSKELSKG